MAMHLKDINEGGVQKFICRVEMEGSIVIYSTINIIYILCTFILYLSILKYT